MATEYFSAHPIGRRDFLHGAGAAFLTSLIPARAEALSRGERRLVNKDRKREGPKRVEQAIQNPQAKKFFTLALAAERRGDIKTAQLNYKFALDLEPDHPTILERKEAVDAKG